MSKTPSIAVIPSGYKGAVSGENGTVYSVLPTNGDADLDFTRNCVSTRVNQNGLLEEVGLNVPRLDYSDGGCPSLPLEPQSTNLVTYSDDFSQWLTTNLTLTPNTIISPNGSLNASTLTSNASFSQLTLGVNTQIGTEYTVSFYLKRKTGTGQVAIKGVENINTNITITNEWQRFSVTATATSISSIAAIRLLTVGDEVYVWGAQFEEQSYTTSYIPTNGAIETRTQDTASKSGLEDYINSQEGVFYFEVATLTNIFSTSESISISDGSTLNRLIFLFSNTNQLDFTSVISSSTGAFISTTLSDSKSYNKIAVYWSQSTFKLFINGVLINTDDRGLSFSANTLNRVACDSGSGGSKLNGKIKDLRVFNEALTDAELITLTQ